MSTPRSQQGSPATSSSSSQGNRPESDPGSGEHSPPSPTRDTPNPPATSTSVSEAVPDPDPQKVLHVGQQECSSPTYTSLPELASVRPLILHHPHMVDGVGPPGDEGDMSWLYDFYPNVLGSSPKDALHMDPGEGEGGPQANFGEDHQGTIFRTQEKYVVTLGAPTSIAQRLGEDTLTYLNKGQFYSLYVSANTRMSLPQRVKTVLALTFIDEPDRRVEFNLWQYWYNLQANPNQKAFDIDRKNCESVIGKPEDLAYNAASFVWTPELGAKIVLRINCLSTEFSSQKGVKGIPLFLQVDTYEDVESELADPVHRALCRIKIFRDKGAERKNKDEIRSVERRMQKFMKDQQAGSSLDAEGSMTSMFHPPNKETVLTSTSTFGPKMFFFTPQQQHDFPSPKVDSRQSNFLVNIKERETKRTFSRALKQAKEDLGALEVEPEPEETPPTKTPKILNQHMTTVYVRKEEEHIYNALLLDSLTVHEFKIQIAKKYSVPADMIKEVLKKTKKGLLVHLDDDMVSHFKDEDDFIIDLAFDNQKGYFNLLIQY